MTVACSKGPSRARDQPTRPRLRVRAECAVLKPSGSIWLPRCLDLLVRIHRKELVAVQKSVSANIHVEAHAFRQLELKFAFWEGNCAVIDAHVLGLEPDWLDGFP